MRIMSSSISSSDRAAWRGFAAVLLVAATGVLVATLSVAYAVDPYDTGRSHLFEKAGVRPQGPRTAAASRGRDPAYNAAIVGNSHIQLLSPERLKEKTGLDFVQLSVPGTGPKEQLVLIDWYLRHRREPAEAIVLSADGTWCTGDSALPNAKPFPFWLFSANSLEYARGLLRYDILEELPRRMRYVFGRAERARPDGYWDYELDYPGLGHGSDPALIRRLDEGKPAGIAHRGPFPAAGRLQRVAATLHPETALIVIFPPSYFRLQPLSGSPGAAGEQACKDALRTAAAAHPRSAVIDWRVDRSENRNPDLFLDGTHFRQPIARAIEDDVAAALQKLR
jgi:hypothetical protein